METARVLWDADEGVLVLGDDIEIKTSEPMQVVRYLVSLGVPVEYVDHDQGTTERFEPPTGGGG